MGKVQKGVIDFWVTLYSEPPNELLKNEIYFNTFGLLTQYIAFLISGWAIVLLGCSQNKSKQAEAIVSDTELKKPDE
ncbi:MAG TPA: hypothetical protein PKY12_01330 [Catalimonadaceae bacterium]|nr:hypothetical protein [Catalimonadaceae bacterium]